jgi:integrase
VKLPLFRASDSRPEEPPRPRTGPTVWRENRLSTSSPVWGLIFFMGSITPYETANGKRYRVRYRKPDRSQTDKRGFSTKREAELFLASVEVSKARGEYVDASAGRVTIGELGADWIRHQDHLKASSALPLEIALRLHVLPRWSLIPVSEVRFTDVQTWVSGIDGGATKVIRAYGVLASILDNAVRDRRILTNPARGVNLPRKEGKEQRYLSHQQLQDLAIAAGSHETLILMLGYTGLRWGEAIGLRVRDIDLGRRRINISVNAVEVGTAIVVGTPKTYKRRSVAFPAFLTGPLAAQVAIKGPDSLVFPGANGDHLRRATRGARSWFKTALVTAGLEPMTLHDLRHTAASLAISSGANVKAVQRMLGHASAAMTLDVYANLFDDDLDAVAEGLDKAARKTIVGKMWA